MLTPARGCFFNTCDMLEIQRRRLYSCRETEQEPVNLFLCGVMSLSEAASGFVIHVARAASNGLAQLSARPVLDEMVLSQAESRQREVICVERDLCLRSRSDLLSNERKWKNDRTEVVAKKGVVWKL